MADPFEIKPTQDLRVMDLVKEAGIDVSDWSNFKGSNPATNPKYCYEWAFHADDRVVLNLWYDEIAERDGQWIQDLRPREWGRSADGAPLRTNWQVRTKRFENAIRAAYSARLPLRVILCSGTRRQIGDANAHSSSVKRRILDPVPWVVTSYNPTTGACLLTRGAEPDAFSDQFSEIENRAPEKHPVTGQQYFRDPDVRRKVRIRANGRCEFCGANGFLTEKGNIYIETHHVIPLFEGGLDTVQNVVALCANHHKEAHYSEAKMAIRQKLKAYLQEMD